MRKYEIARKLGAAEHENTELIKRNTELRYNQEHRDDEKKSDGDDGDAIGKAYIEVVPRFGLPDEARVPVLAVALMLKNKADAMDVNEGADLEVVLDRYAYVGELRALLGDTTEEERAEATALWDDTAA